MKKSFKWILLFILMVPCLFIFSACNQQKYVVGIERSQVSTSLTDVYTITYSDGSTGSFTIENGKDGSDLSIEDIYEAAKDNGYQGDFLDFLQDYLNQQSNPNTMLSTNKAMTSAVSVVCEFPVVGGSFFTPTNDTAIGSGAGVIYKLDKQNGDAYIITNYHVVYNSSSKTENKIASNIKVYLYGGDMSRGYLTNGNDEIVYKDLNGNVADATTGYPAIQYSSSAIDCEYVGGSMLNDIAVLKVTGSNVLKNSSASAVQIANSDEVDVGGTAIAIGNPSGEGFSATQGVISVDSEYFTMTGADGVTQVTFRVIRVDAALNSGNSGGGLFDQNGDLIGIVNAKLVDSKIENIGYAIPSNVASRVADSIIANLAAKKATVGITIKAENSRSVYDAQTGKISIVQDVHIDQITEGSIAANSSLAVGDKIVSVTIKGQKYTISRTYQLVDLVWLAEVGDVIYFEVEGKSEPVSVIVTSECINVVA